MLRRLILTAALALTPTFLAAQNLAPQDPPACKIDDYCIRDQFLRIDLDDFRIRDTIANISLTYTNPTPEDYELSIYSIYLIATSANNERIELSTNRQRIFIGAGATRTEAFSLKFAEPVGPELDLIFIFENPDARYALLGIRASDFDELPTS